MAAQVETQKLKTIRLYGKLGTTFGRIHRMAVSSASEAIRALCITIPGFEKYLQESSCKYAVFNGKENLAVDQFGQPSGNQDIRIAPVPVGAKNGGFMVVLGIVLVVVGFFTFGSTTTTGMALIAGGVAMAAAGAVMLLSPQPKSANAEGVENRPSYAFNGPVNTIAQGNCVPVGYGRMIVGSAVISGGVYIEERS
jgi:predicted phage tail protein